MSHSFAADDVTCWVTSSFASTKRHNIATCAYAKRLHDTFMDSIKRWPRHYECWKNLLALNWLLIPFEFDATVCERSDIRRARRRSRFGELLKIHQAAKFWWLGSVRVDVKCRQVDDLRFHEASPPLESEIYGRKLLEKWRKFRVESVVNRFGWENWRKASEKLVQRNLDKEETWMNLDSRKLKGFRY